MLRGSTKPRCCIGRGCCRTTAPLYLPDDRQHVGRVTVSAGGDSLHSGLTRLCELWVSQLNPTSFGACQCIPRPCGNHAALFLCQRSEQMQNEGVNVSTKLSNDELHTLCNQATDKVNAARQAVQLGNGHGALAAATSCEGGGKLRAT